LELDETIDIQDLVNTTNVDVYEDGRVFDDDDSNVGSPSQNPLTLTAGTGSNSESSVVTTYDEVTQFVSRHGGWYFEFENVDPTSGGFDQPNPAIRNTTLADLAGDSLAITAYEATLEFCDSEGYGLLYSPAFHTGAPAPFAPAGVAENITIPNTGSGDPVSRVLQGITLTKGVPSAPVITRSSEVPPGEPDPGCDLYNVWIQSSTGVLDGEDLGCDGTPVGRNSWREIPVDFDWVTP
jgi:hypothetical protein